VWLTLGPPHLPQSVGSLPAYPEMDRLLREGPTSPTAPGTWDRAITQEMPIALYENTAERQ
jgi:hypothetical protein